MTKINSKMKEHLIKKIKDLQIVTKEMSDKASNDMESYGSFMYSFACENIIQMIEEYDG